MSYSVTPWSSASGLSRDAIKSVFDNENLSASTWFNGPGDRYAAHTHSYHKVLFCVEGSIIFHIEGEDAELRPGDRLDLPAGISHAATVGPDGVVCMEGSR